MVACDTTLGSSRIFEHRFCVTAWVKLHETQLVAFSMVSRRPGEIAVLGSQSAMPAAGKCAHVLWPGLSSTVLIAVAALALRYKNLWATLSRAIRVPCVPVLGQTQGIGSPQ